MDLENKEVTTHSLQKNFDFLDDYLSYSSKLGRCVNGDSLEVLRKFDNNSIDLLMTSPPFGLVWWALFLLSLAIKKIY